MESSELKNRVIRRVRRIYYLRVFINPLTLKIYALGLLGGLASLAVSIPDVIRNAPTFTDLEALYTFSTFSLTHTEVAVQLMVLVALAVFLWLVRDIARSLRGHSYSLRAS